ncbi:MAG: hypothetical protein ABI184_10035 [Ginsengibacter sp.]
MNKLVQVYYIIMAICFFISLFYLQHKKIKILSLLLFLSIITELGVEVLNAQGHNYFILYHFFTIAEYSLITLLLRDGIPIRFIRKIMLYSIFIFGILSLLISLFLQRFDQFPAISNSIEGLLIITWSILALWYIDASENITIFQQPGFWFALSFLIYYAGTIAFNGIYNYLLHDKTETARRLFAIINSFGNYLLYLLLIIGILRYQWKKSIPQ